MPFLDDLRFSLRSLGRTPGFTATAVLVLALGVGLNLGLFAVVNALLLEPLGGPAAGELVSVYDHDRVAADRYRGFSYPDYRTIRGEAGAFSHVLAQQQVSVGVTEGETSRRVFATLVSANYFSTLAARPAAGRDFRLEDERVGAPPVAIVSDRYWRQHGGDPNLLGSTVRVNGRDVAIVGIAPAGFSGAMAMFSPDLWLPLGACAIAGTDDNGAEATDCLERRDRRELALVGSLRPGVTRAAATASLAPIGLEMERADGARGGTRELVVANMSRLSIGNGPSGDSGTAAVMVFLSALALLVLLIASLNLANMLLARSTARQGEVAVRFALGSSRWRVFRLLLTESTLVVTAGTSLGLALAVVTTRLLAAGLAGSLPFAIAFDATPDRRVLAVTGGLAVLALLVCGLAPALGLARASALSHLKRQAGQAEGGARHMSLRNVLVVGQLATSLALLTAAALFVKGAVAASGGDPGFSLERGIVATVSPALSGYPETRGRETYERLLARLRSHPAAVSASLASSVPLGLDSEGAAVRDASGGDKAEPEFVLLSSVGTEYFRTLGVPLLRGREFTALEERTTSASRPVIVDQAVAAKLWPGRDALGQRLQMETGQADWTAPMEVVGVVPSVRQSLFDSRPPLHIYLPAGSEYRGQMFFHVKLKTAGAGAETAAARSIRQVLREEDRGLAVLGVDTLRGHRDKSIHLWIARASAALFGAIGLVALLLAVLGVYGVKSYLVSRRRKEIAIRMAVGAGRGDVLWLVVRDGLALTACGLTCGLALALALSKVLAAWVYGAGALDLLPVAAAAAVLAGAAVLACYAPVRRATACSPWATLRAE